MKKFKSDCFFFSHNSSLLKGYDVYSFKLLKIVNKFSNNKKDKEHVGSFYIKKNLTKFNTLRIDIPKIFRTSKFKISIDTKTDYENIKNLIYLNKSFKINLKNLIRIMERNKDKILKPLKKNESIDNRLLNKIKIVKKKFNNRVLLDL